MVQPSTGKNIVSKSAVFAVRMCSLFVLLSSTLLLTGCASVSPDERAIFYSGWGNPNNSALIQ